MKFTVFEQCKGRCSHIPHRQTAPQRLWNIRQLPNRCLYTHCLPVSVALHSDHDVKAMMARMSPLARGRIEQFSESCKSDILDNCEVLLKAPVAMKIVNTLLMNHLDAFLQPSALMQRKLDLFLALHLRPSKVRRPFIACTALI